MENAGASLLASPSCSPCVFDSLVLGFFMDQEARCTPARRRRLGRCPAPVISIRSPPPRTPSVQFRAALRAAVGTPRELEIDPSYAETGFVDGGGLRTFVYRLEGDSGTVSLQAGYRLFSGDGFPPSPVFGWEDLVIKDAQGQETAIPATSTWRVGLRPLESEADSGETDPHGS